MFPPTFHVLKGLGNMDWYRFPNYWRIKIESGVECGPGISFTFSDTMIGYVLGIHVYRRKTNGTGSYSWK